MLWIDSRSIDSQNKIITDLKDDIVRLQNRNKDFEQRIEDISEKGQFYLDMQYRIMDNPDLMKAWKRFIMMVKMTLDNPVQGLTYEKKGGPISHEMEEH